MKREEIKNKTKRLILNENFEKYLMREVDNIVDSEFVNYTDEDKESFGLAKVILYCSLKRLAEQYKPLSNFYLKEYKQLLKNY